MFTHLINSQSVTTAKSDRVSQKEKEQSQFWRENGTEEWKTVKVGGFGVKTLVLALCFPRIGAGSSIVLSKGQ